MTRQRHQRRAALIGCLLHHYTNTLITSGSPAHSTAGAGRGAPSWCHCPCQLGLNGRTDLNGLIGRIHAASVLDASGRLRWPVKVLGKLVPSIKNWSSGTSSSTIPDAPKCSSLSGPRTLTRHHICFARSIFGDTCSNYNRRLSRWRRYASSAENVAPPPQSSNPINARELDDCGTVF